MFLLSGVARSHADTQLLAVAPGTAHAAIMMALASRQSPLLCPPAPHALGVAFLWVRPGCQWCSLFASVWASNLKFKVLEPIKACSHDAGKVLL